MTFNKMIPELTVFDIEQTKAFYIDVLGFTLEYERPDDKFIFLSFEGSQFMFEEYHEDGWNISAHEYPLGIGINFSIETSDVEGFYERLHNGEVVFYRELVENTYEVQGEMTTQKEFIIQDPNGYLFRFTN